MNHPAHFGQRQRMGLLLILAVTLAAVMQWTQQYRFYAKEVEHLWLNDSLWIVSWLKVPGGMAQLMTSALTQFFGICGVGASVMSVLLTSLIGLGWGITRKLGGSTWVMSWWLLPVAFLFLCHENGYYGIRGTLSTVLAVGGAWWYARHQLGWLAVVLIGLTFWMAGASAGLLALMIVAIELMNGRRWLIMGLSVLTVVLAAGLAVRHGVWISMEEALTPAQYYEWPSTYYTPIYAWVSMLVLLLLASNKRQPKMTRVLSVLGVLVSVTVASGLYSMVHNPRIYLLREDEWRASQEDWDGIIASHEGLNTPTPFISYLNLALAQKGQLVQRMGEFRPYIAWSDEAQMYSPVLMTQNELSRDALKLQSCVCMAWGGAALSNAQKAAYEANFLTPGDTDPVELHRLALTNQLFETPATAQKYLRRLSRTTMHHAWADERLTDPSLLAHEAESLGKTLPEEDGFYMKTQVVRCLHQTAYQHPENQVATQFYEAYLIQSRDSVAFRHWHEFLDEQGTKK